MSRVILLAALPFMLACPDEPERALAAAAPAETMARVAEGVVKKAQPPSVDHVVLAGQRVEAPEGFQLQLVQQPPLEKLSASSGNTRCDFGILLGHESEEERARLVKAMRSSYPGKKTPYVKEAAGTRLDGVEIKASQTRLFSAKVGKDLLAVSYAGADADRCDPLLERLVEVLGGAG